MAGAFWELVLVLSSFSTGLIGGLTVGGGGGDEKVRRRRRGKGIKRRRLRLNVKTRSIICKEEKRKKGNKRKGLNWCCFRGEKVENKDSSDRAAVAMAGGGTTGDLRMNTLFYSFFFYIV